MENNSQSPYAIYLKSEKCWVPVSEEFYREYTRMNDTVRRKMQRHKCCVCPKSKFWLCDSDCATCVFCTGSLALSLDCLGEPNDNGSDSAAIGDILPLPYADFESEVEDRMMLDLLYTELEKLDPSGRRILQLSISGMSEREIADAIGAKSQSLVNYKKRRIIEQLRSCLNDKK